MTIENLEINVKTNAGDAAKSVRSLGDALKSLQGTAVNLTRYSSSLGSLFKRILRIRLVRNTITEITKAFSEGLKNAYLFSSGIAGEGGRFAAAMDSMQSAATRMKNQLGSAFISLLTSVEPIINELVNVVTKAADSMSQLIAAFTGTTYLKAAEVSDTFADHMKSGAKAAKEWKKQLLGFDVMNRLSAPSESSGGGLTTSEMFGGEAAPIDEKWKKIADFVKKIIPDMETLKQLAKDAALLFISWEIGKAFGKSLKETVGFVLLAYSAFRMISDILKTIDEGITWDNLKNLLIDVAGLAAGAYLAFGRIGAGIALVVGGAALIVTAFNDMKENGMNLINTLGMIAGLFTAGLGISVLTKSWIPLALAAVASLVVYLVYAFGEGENFTEGMTKIFSGLGQFFKNIFAGDVEEAMKGVKLAWEGAKQVGQAVTNAMRKAWQGFLDWIGDRLGPKWKAFFESASKTVTDFVSNNVKGLKGLVEFVSGAFTGDWSRAWQGVKDVLAAEANHMLNIAAFFVNGFIDGVNGLINGMNAIAGKVPDWLEFANFIVPGLGSILTAPNNLKLSAIPTWTPPQFESGGFPDSGSLFFARESGPELVGSIGGHTAVANNDQIESAIYRAVYDATMAANERSSEKPIVVQNHTYLDSREIKAGQTRLARSMGI